jgi:hypothetical protein
VLADVQAEDHRARLDSQLTEDRCYECGTRPLVLLRLLALPYARHPDYREEWWTET